MSVDTERFAKELSDLTRRIRELERGSRAPQLGNSSIDLGTSRGYIPILENGVERGRIGRQPDGSISTAFPNDESAPPIPKPPILEQTVGGVRITVPGLVGDATPYNFSHCRVYVDGLINGTVASLPGSWIAAPLSVALHAFSVTSVNLSGVESEPTDFLYLTPGAAVAGEILDGAVTTIKLANLAVSQAKLALAAVGTGQIQGNAVDLSKLADGSVDATKLLDNAVTNPKVAPTAITTDKITPASVTAALILANTITAAQIAGDTITASQIASSAIAANELAANAVIAGKVAAGTITTTELAALTIQAGNIATDAIAAGKIAADAVTAREILALTITADKIAANAINATHIEAGTVSADKLAAEIILASNITIGDPTNWHLEFNPESASPLLWTNNEQTGFALQHDASTGISSVYVSGRMDFGDGSRIDSDILDLQELPTVGFATPKIRQQRSWIQSALGTTINAKWPSPTMKGSFIILSVYQSGGGTTPNCSTPSGATILDSKIYNNTRLTTFYVTNAPASRSVETFGSSAGSTKWAITLTEYTGLDAAALDVYVAGASGTSSTATTGTTATTTAANEVCIAIVGAASGQGANGNMTAPTNGFNKSIVSGSGGGFGTGVFSKTVTSTGTQSMSVTLPGTPFWTATILTLKIGPATPIPTAPSGDTVRYYTKRVNSIATPHIMQADSYTYPITRGPYAKLHLTTNYLGTAGADVYAQSNWVIDDDPHNICAISTSGGTYTQITIPITGLYRVEFRTIWQESTNTTNQIINFITLNTRAAANSIARGCEMFRNNVNDGSPVHCHRTLRLTAGGVLYWGTFCGVAANVYASKFGVPTEVTVTWLGPGV